MCTLKGHVRTKSHPEGSIAEGYLFDECLNFCTRYLEGCGARISRNGINGVPEPECSSMPFFNSKGHYLAGKYTIPLDQKTWLKAHRYVLFNYDNIFPYPRFVIPKKKMLLEYEFGLLNDLLSLHVY